MFRIIPRDQEFFVLFQKASSNIVEGGGAPQGSPRAVRRPAGAGPGDRGGGAQGRFPHPRDHQET